MDRGAVELESSEVLSFLYPYLLIFIPILSLDRPY